jgi:hypothetical protein
VSALGTLRRVRSEKRDREQEAFARRLSELRLAEELLRRASARWESQRGRVARRAEARVSVFAAGDATASVVTHARHESRLRHELEALAFGREVARREFSARAGRRDEARDALARAEASLAVLERLLVRREAEGRRRLTRRSEESR